MIELDVKNNNVLTDVLNGDSHPRYRASIDGLRAIAVLGVVLYHLNPAWLSGGFAGVDVFFVISGYLISLIVFRELDTGSFSFSRFYARRARRLFPALILVIFASLLFGWFSLFADEFGLLGRHISSAVIFLANFRLMGEAGYFDVASHLKPLLHLWSLAIEEQFYLAWPLLLVLSTKLKVSRLRLLTGFLLLSIVASCYLYTISATAHFFNPLSRFWELLCGAGLAYVRMYKPQLLARASTPRSMVGACGLVLIAASYFILSPALIYPSVWALLPVVGAMLIISAQGGPIEQFLGGRLLVFIGLISYPLYLWHWPIFSYLRIIESGEPSLSLLMLGAFLAVLLSWLTYALVEKRLRYSRSPLVISGLFISLLFLFLAGKAIKSNEGFPEREQLKYLSASMQQMIRAPRSDEQCINYVALSKPPAYCRMEPGRELLAVIGDSHAHVLFSGLAEIRAKQGLGTILLANSGCPPFQGSTFGKTSLERATCVDSIEKIVSQIANDVSIRQVLIASRGPQYIDGLGFGPVEKNYNYPPLLDAAGMSKEPAEVFRDGVTATVKRLQEAGKEVTYALQVPELGVSPRDCLGRPLFLLNETSCKVSRAVYEQRMKEYRGIMSAIAAERHIRLFDPESAMCSGDDCYMSRDAVLLYADDNHLSIAGSRRLAPVIADFIGTNRTSIPDPEER